MSRAGRGSRPVIHWNAEKFSSHFRKLNTKIVCVDVLSMETIQFLPLI